MIGRRTVRNDFIRMLTGLGNGILTSSVYIVEVVAASRRGSVVMVSNTQNKWD